jgi:hypothetical protein
VFFFLFGSFTDVSTDNSSGQPLPRLSAAQSSSPWNFACGTNAPAALLSTATPTQHHTTSAIIEVATSYTPPNGPIPTHHHHRHAHCPPIPPSHLRRVATQRQHALLSSRLCKVSAASQLQPPSPSCVPVPAFLSTPAIISPQHTIPTRRDSYRLNRYCCRPILHRTT